LRQKPYCQAFQALSVVVTLFSGDFYNISHSPILMQAFFKNHLFEAACLSFLKAAVFSGEN
ncbi:hypothetical protein, partial [Paenibacillus ehimensis]|uniref:hypothetical protein n=1 Tax=Paenibacillus ehimensis TaxID=79264 RepID=UPI001C3FCB54